MFRVYTAFFAVSPTGRPEHTDNADPGHAELTTMSCAVNAPEAAASSAADVPTRPASWQDIRKRRAKTISHAYRFFSPSLCSAAKFTCGRADLPCCPKEKIRNVAFTASMVTSSMLDSSCRLKHDQGDGLGHCLLSIQACICCGSPQLLHGFTHH